MKSLTIRLKNLPPMPRNRSHRMMRGMLIKTELARAFEDDVKERLSAANVLDDIAQWKKAYRPKEHAIQLTLFIETPEKVLFTKERTISQNSVDADAHKLLLDMLAKATYDDSQFCDLRVIKCVSRDEFWNFTAKFETYSRDKLYDYINPEKSEILLH